MRCARNPTSFWSVKFAPPKPCASRWKRWRPAILFFRPCTPAEPGKTLGRMRQMFNLEQARGILQQYADVGSFILSQGLMPDAAGKICPLL